MVLSMECCGIVVVNNWVTMEIAGCNAMTTKRRARQQTGSEDNGATTGYESQLWQMADALRGSMDAAEYKHVVLGLLFLKYVSDAFEELYRRVAEGKGEYENANPEDKDEYRGDRHFLGAQRIALGVSKSQARQPTIGLYWWITRWRDRDAPTRRSKTSCPKITGVQTWISRAWGD